MPAVKTLSSGSQCPRGKDPRLRWSNQPRQIRCVKQVGHAHRVLERDAHAPKPRRHGVRPISIDWRFAGATSFVAQALY